MPLFLFTLSKGVEMKASSLFVAMPLLNMLNYMVISHLTQGFSVASQYYAVLLRFQDVLKLEEKKEEFPQDESKCTSIDLLKVSSSWPSRPRVNSFSEMRVNLESTSIDDEKTSLLSEEQVKSSQF